VVATADIGQKRSSLPKPLGPLADALRDVVDGPDATYTALAFDPASTPVLAELLGHPDPFVRLMAARCLCDGGGERVRLAVPTLTALLGDARAHLRRRAAEVLETAGAFSRDAARPAVPALVRALGDEDKLVRVYAGEALRAIDPEAARWAGVEADEGTSDEQR
jgi:HEAT repeat protein